MKWKRNESKSLEREKLKSNLEVLRAKKKCRKVSLKSLTMTAV